MNGTNVTAGKFMQSFDGCLCSSCV